MEKISFFPHIIIAHVPVAFPLEKEKQKDILNIIGAWWYANKVSVGCYCQTTFSPNSTAGVEKDAEGPEQKVNE